MFNPTETHMTKTKSSKPGIARDIALHHAETSVSDTPETRSDSSTYRATDRKKNRKSTPQTSKKSKLMKLLCRSRGASMAELEKALGWQPHSIRAAISGLRKSGHTVERAATKTGSRYQIIEALEAPRVIAA